MIMLPLRLQDLPPSQAHLVLKVEKYIQKYITSFQGYTFFVACSGGSDSLALLFILYYLKPRLGYSLHVLHCNHMLREEAYEEERYVCDISRLLGLPYHTATINIKEYAQQHTIGLEEAGRICRYDFFYNILAQYPSSLLCTGHHANDLAEDLIMRLLRGTSLDMLCAMPAFSSIRSLLRPLLFLPKQELITFLKAIHLSWREDISNYDTTFLRSRIRMTMLPLLLQENPSFLNSITALHEQTEWDIDYWEHLLSPYDPIKISCKDLLSLHKAGRMRIYRKACSHLATHPSFDTFLAIDSAILAKRVCSFRLSKYIIVKITIKEVTFEHILEETI